jgi:hypothetical protein
VGLLKAKVLGRVLFPSAKLALGDHARGTLLAAACGLDQATEDFDEEDLYAAMDQLTGQWVPLETQRYRQGFHQGVSLVLDDLPSVCFEGGGPWRIRRYGHSRDLHSDRPQIMLAVATDTQGVPLHLEVLRGIAGPASSGPKSGDKKPGLDRKVTAICLDNCYQTVTSCHQTSDRNPLVHQ